MTRSVLLLRGINVGRAHRIAMADLRALLQAEGHGQVQTLLQSGNVVLTSDTTGAKLERELEEAIAAELGVQPRVVVRTVDELAAVVERDPFGDVADQPKLYQVSFLSEELAPAAAKELEAADVAPERVAVHGREIYAWHPNGVQRSPLAALLTDKKLGVAATARNWNTVTKLLELAREA